MKFFIIVGSMLLSLMNYSQEPYFSPDTVGRKTVSDNIYNKPAFNDSLASSFCILIKKEVKLHKHLTHSEHVVVLEGEGKMTLGDKTFYIQKGDLVFIPKNTAHAVKNEGTVPLKVYSIQSPSFDGKDRVMIEK
jgi:mannose-6-phosphate isomerase-like protein (cupin superfamily)